MENRILGIRPSECIYPNSSGERAINYEGHGGHGESECTAENAEVAERPHVRLGIRCVLRGSMVVPLSFSVLLTLDFWTPYTDFSLANTRHYRS